VGSVGEWCGVGCWWDCDVFVWRTEEEGRGGPQSHGTEIVEFVTEIVGDEVGVVCSIGVKVK